MDESRLYPVPVERAGDRLDVYLAQAASDLSRSRVQSLIAEGLVSVNENSAKANYRVKTGDRVLVRVPAPVETTAVAEPIPLDILYEDPDLIVVNKPRGMVVHPAAGHYRDTLVNALLYHCSDLSGINGCLRPGIVHRIDKDTSGVLVAAKNDHAHESLAIQIKEHTVTRVYLALVDGQVNTPALVVDAPIGRHPVERQRMAVVGGLSRRAVTHIRVLERFAEFSLIEARLETGRTHQIRVHMSYMGHPVVGDPKYGKGAKNPFGLIGQALHARLLGFRHPRTGEYMEFEAPLPLEMQNIMEILRKR